MLIVRRIVQILGFAVYSIYIRIGGTNCLQTEALITTLYMAYKNIFERNNIVAINSLVEENFVALDVGAGFGFYSKIFSKLLPKGHVHSFEPNSLNFRRCQRLKEKYSKNDNITINPIALTSEKGIRRLKIDNVNPANHSILESDTRFNTYEDVEATTIDSYCKENNITPNFIKIDIQGHEIYCLAGAREVLRSATNLSLLIELDFINHKEKSHLVLDFLLGMNYTAFSHSRKNGFEKFDVSEIRKEYLDVFFFKSQ